MNKQSWYIALLVGLGLCLLAVVSTRHYAVPKAGVEEHIARVEATLTCPLKPEFTAGSSLEHLAVCARFGDSAFRAVQQYREGVEVFNLYGDTEEFKQALREYGHRVIPVVAFFYKNDAPGMRLKEAARNLMQRMWSDNDVALKYGELTPFERGALAIAEVNLQGLTFLDRFEIVGGVAVRSPTKTIMSGASSLFLGGIKDLDRILVRGERRPTLTELGLAGLDAAIFVGAFKAVKALRVSRGVTVAGRATEVTAAATRVTPKMLGSSIWTLGKTVAPTAALVGTGYVMYQHPSLITALGGKVAELAGLPSWVGSFGIWLLLWVVFASLVTTIMMPIKVIMACIRLPGRCVRGSRAVYRFGAASVARLRGA